MDIQIYLIDIVFLVLFDSNFKSFSFCMFITSSTFSDCRLAASLLDSIWSVEIGVGFISGGFIAIFRL